jgi:hypothetical protein
MSDGDEEKEVPEVRNIFNNLILECISIYRFSKRNRKPK